MPLVNWTPTKFAAPRTVVYTCMRMQGGCMRWVWNSGSRSWTVQWPYRARRAGGCRSLAWLSSQRWTERWIIIIERVRLIFQQKPFFFYKKQRSRNRFDEVLIYDFTKNGSGFSRSSSSLWGVQARQARPQKIWRDTKYGETHRCACIYVCMQYHYHLCSLPPVLRGHAIHIHRSPRVCGPWSKSRVAAPRVHHTHTSNAIDRHTARQRNGPADQPANVLYAVGMYIWSSLVTRQLTMHSHSNAASDRLVWFRDA
jgi:hypothetical protein